MLCSYPNIYFLWMNEQKIISRQSKIHTHTQTHSHIWLVFLRPLWACHSKSKATSQQAKIWAWLSTDFLRNHYRNLKVCVYLWKYSDYLKKKRSCIASRLHCFATGIPFHSLRCLLLHTHSNSSPINYCISIINQTFQMEMKINRRK